MKIDANLNKLANHILQEALKTGEDAPSFEEKTEALKTATALYAILMKYKQKQDDGDGTDTFEDFATKLKNAEAPPNGNTKVRSRRGTGLQS